MVRGQVEAHAEREGVEVEFSRGQERDDGADNHAADCDIADYATVARGAFLGEALLRCEDGLGRGHCGAARRWQGVRMRCESVKGGLNVDCGRSMFAVWFAVVSR